MHRQIFDTESKRKENREKRMMQQQKCGALFPFGLLPARRGSACGLAFLFR